MSKKNTNPKAVTVTVNDAAKAAAKEANNPPSDTAANAAQNTGAAQKKNTKKAVPVVYVVGPQKGRYRAGRHFGPERTEIPRKELSASQLAALHADPELLVLEGEVSA